MNSSLQPSTTSMHACMVHAAAGIALPGMQAGSGAECQEKPAAPGSMQYGASRRLRARSQHHDPCISGPGAWRKQRRSGPARTPWLHWGSSAVAAACLRTCARSPVHRAACVCVDLEKELPHLLLRIADACKGQRRVCCFGWWTSQRGAGCVDAQTHAHACKAQRA